MTEDTSIQASEVEDNELMTPEEMALWKKLQEKRKKQKNLLKGTKDELFNSLTENFGSAMAKCKKDVSTISMKEKAEDGNLYAISFGVEEEESEEIDTEALAQRIINENMHLIDQLMGMSSSAKLSGEYNDKKLFWQIRKK